MSDNTATDEDVIDYEARSDGEMDALADQMQFGERNRARYGGYNYVGQPEPGYDVPGVWTCHFADSRSGYAHVGHALAYAIHDGLRLPHQLIPHRMRGVLVDDVPSDRQDDIARWMNGKVGLGRALVVCLPPPGAAQMNGYGKTEIVCYVTHECDRVSPTCAEICNPTPDDHPPGFAKVWVKSPFALRAFAAGGVREERMRLVEPPLIGGPWKVPTPLERANRRAGAAAAQLVEGADGAAVAQAAPSSTFRFGMLGTWIARKGFEELLMAYYDAFTRADDVVLEIKTSPLSEVGSIHEMQELCVKAATRAREAAGRQFDDRARVVFHIGTEQTDQDVIDWITGLDAFANSSFGEGLGVPQIYAMAAGVPLVTTGFGAVGELAEWHLGFDGAQKHEIVEHTLARIDRDMLAVSRMYDPGQKWGVYAPADFGDAMRRVFDRGVEAANDPEANVSDLRARFSFDTRGQALREALAELIDLSELA